MEARDLGERQIEGSRRFLAPEFFLGPAPTCDGDAGEFEVPKMAQNE
jgi:hypothetical protein